MSTSDLFRASRPQLQFPAIMYNICTVVASTYPPQFSTMAEGIPFVEGLLGAFLIGFTVAAFVSFLIITMTSGRVLFRQAAEYTSALQGALKAQSAYLQSLGDKNAFGIPNS